MTRTTISLPERLLRKAKKAAAEQNISMAELIRRTLEGTLELPAEELPRRFESAGTMDSGETDVSVRVGDMKLEPRSWR